MLTFVLSCASAGCCDVVGRTDGVVDGGGDGGGGDGGVAREDHEVDAKHHSWSGQEGNTATL